MTSTGGSQGFGINLPTKSPIGIQANTSDNFSQSSYNRNVDIYTKKDCEALLKMYGQVQLAKITAETIVEVARIQANASVGIARIGAESAIHESDNSLAATRDLNRAITKTSISANQTSLINTGIQAGAGLLGFLVNSGSHNKDHELELQLQRERQQHELRMLEMQRVASNPQNFPATVSVTPGNIHSSQLQENLITANPQAPTGGYQAAPSHPLPSGQTILTSTLDPKSAVATVMPVLSSLEREIQARLGLVIDTTCSQGSMIIKTMNGQIVCAVPRPPYAPGRYFFNGQDLVILR